MLPNVFRYHTQYAIEKIALDAGIPKEDAFALVDILADCEFPCDSKEGAKW